MVADITTGCQLLFAAGRVRLAARRVWLAAVGGLCRLRANRQRGQQAQQSENLAHNFSLLWMFFGAVFLENVNAKALTSSARVERDRRTEKAHVGKQNEKKKRRARKREEAIVNAERRRQVE